MMAVAAKKLTHLRRLPWQCLAWGCIVVGALGAFLPLLPTTPFLLIAAWAAPKSSAQLAHWLHNHVTFGPLLRAWQQHKAVPTKAKLVACVMMATSWFTLWASGSTGAVLLVAGVLFIAVMGFLISRPSAKI